MFEGNLIDSLVSTVEAAGTSTKTVQRPTLIHKQDGRDFIRLVVIPPETEIHCSNVDCAHTAQLLIEARDQEVLAFCKECSYVEFAMWMVGV